MDSNYSFVQICGSSEWHVLSLRGGKQLSGVVRPSGNKNSALKLLPACLLTDEPVVLHNVPDIEDMHTMKAIMQSLGVELSEQGDNSLRVHAKDVNKYAIDRELAINIRASIVLAGPMLARLGRLELPPPGGDVIGRRRVDTHIMALQALGATIEIGDTFKMEAKQLRGGGYAAG